LKVREAIRLAMDILELDERVVREFIETLLFAKALLGDDVDGVWSF